MDLRIAGTVNDSITDGSGIRFVIFFQGCLHHCPGCQNPQTQSLTGGFVVSHETILEKIRQNPILDGITLSGGEPMLQAKGAALLAHEAHQMGLRVNTYTGYLWEDLIRSGNQDWLNLLKETDYLIDGPYLKAQRNLNLLFRGSENQRIIDVPQSLKAKTPILYFPEHRLMKRSA